MKTKLSKRILSVLLAALMVITSIPIVAVTAFAEESPTKPITDAMAYFNRRLQETDDNGKPVLLKGVANAYAKYVECQKALDAYLYGGKTDALGTLATQLNTAVDQIDTFTGYQGTKVPSFTDSTETEMSQNDDKAFWNNILWTEKCTAAVTGNFGTDSVDSYVYYSANTVMLYDGDNSTMMPVMAMAQNNTDNKTRRVFGVYPCDSNGDDASGMALKDYWKWSSGTGTLDFDYAVYSPDGTPGYNAATGKKGNQDSSKTHASTELKKKYRKYIWNDWTYYPQHGANGLSFSKPTYTTVNGESLPYAKYTPTWYVGTGDGANSDEKNNKTQTTTAPIYVIDYSYALEGLAEAGGRMKTISPSNYSEGGLTNYINAMEAVTAFNPNNSFTSSTNLETTVQSCARSIKTLTDTAKTTAVTANNPDYQILRNAMTETIKDTYAAGNGTGFYTTDSWNAFTTAYDAIKNIMAACNVSGYDHDFSQKSAQSLADDLRLAAAPYNAETGKGLKSNVRKVDTTGLLAVIESFEQLITDNPGVFTDASIASVQSVVDTAKSVVWHNGTLIEANTDDYSENAQNVVTTHTNNITAALANLRISPEAPTVLSNGQFSSLNFVISLSSTIDNPDNYGHWSDYIAAHNAAVAYVDTLATTPYTNLETQLQQYNAVVQEVQTRYDALTLIFTLLEDGTIIQTGSQNKITTLEKHENGNKYNWWIDFDYPSSAILFKTEHNAKTLTYGKANLTYRINIDNNINMPNNAIDSITINGTANGNNEINSNNHVLTSGNINRPPSLSDSEKGTYAGCLAVDGFSLANFRIGHATNDAYNYYGRLNDTDGTYISDKKPANDAFATILGTTDGLGSSAPTPGCINLRPGAKGDAEISLAADMNVYVRGADELTADQLTLDTKPSLSQKDLQNRYFGATIIWNTQPANNFAGYSYLTSKDNNQSLESHVYVIDVSYLFDLIRECKRLDGKGEMFKDNLWSAFSTALEEASDEMEYVQLAQYDGAQGVLNECQARYTKLFKAWKALEYKTFDVDFVYKNEQGVDQTRTFTVNYGETLQQHQTAIGNISKPSYDTDGGAKTWTFSSWSPAVDYTTPIQSNITYTAQYTYVDNYASWEAYNQAVDLLLAALEDHDYVYYSQSLRNAATAISELTYFTYTDAQKATVLKTNQAAINAEKDVINSIRTEILKTVSIDTTAAAAYADEGKKAVLDIDRYDTARLEQYKVASFYYEPVTVNGASIIGVKYESQTAINTEINAVANALNSPDNIKSYQIYLDGTPIGDPVLFGTPVVVDSDGTLHSTNVTDTDANANTDFVSWRYSYAAPSNEFTPTKPKYMVTAPSFGFIVKGNTYLTTTKAKESGSSYTVTVLSAANGKLIDKVTTSGKYEMPVAPNYTGYAFAGYANGKAAGEEITVSADTTIYANYEVRTVDTFQIDFYAEEAGFSQVEAPVPTREINAKYNELVQLTATNAYCWVNAEYDMTAESFTYKIVHYGSSYSFYAYESVADRAYQCAGIVALTYDDLVRCVSNDPFIDVVDVDGNLLEATGNSYDGYNVAPVATVRSLDNLVNVYNSDGTIAKYSMVGQFTVPAGYTMVECGFVYAADTSLKDLKLQNVDNNRAYRYKCSRYTCGNQFVINLINNNVQTTFNYAPYVIVRDKDNNLIEINGTVHFDVTIN